MKFNIYNITGDESHVTYLSLTGSSTIFPNAIIELSVLRSKSEPIHSQRLLQFIVVIDMIQSMLFLLQQIMNCD